MAKRLKPGDTGDKAAVAGGPAKYTKASLEPLLNAINSKKEEARESNGEAAGGTKSAAEHCGVHPQTVTEVAKYRKMDAAKRTTRITDLMTMLNILGYLDEGTLFGGSPRERAAAASSAGAETPTTAPAKSKDDQDWNGAAPTKDEEDKAAAASNVTKLNAGIKEKKSPVPPAPPNKSEKKLETTH